MSQPFFLNQGFLRESASEKYGLSDSIFNSIEDGT